MSPVELPFLYQTRTILRSSLSALTLRTAKCSQKSQRFALTTASPPTEEHPESLLSQKARDSTDSARRKNKPSITRAEKQVFEGIFNDIETSSERDATGNDAINGIEPFTLLRLFLKESDQHVVLHKANVVKPKTRENPNTSSQDHVRRYPSSLRNDARRVTFQQPTSPRKVDQLPYTSFQPSEQDAQSRSADRGTVKDLRHGIYRPLHALAMEAEEDDHAVNGLQLRNFDATKEDEAARGTFRGKTADFVEEELRKISEELRSCISPTSPSGAFKVWDIFQQKILPIVLVLEKLPTTAIQKKLVENEVAAGVPLADSRPGKAVTTRNVKNAPGDSSPKEPPPVPASTFHIPQDVSPLIAVTTLYPTLTLLLLRLLTTHFPTTPFPLSLYATLKATSPHSRILALNIHFYNTLLAHIWHVYSALHSISSTLAEMQASGIDFDATTYTFLCAIEHERWRALHTDDQGSRGRNWWLTREQTMRHEELMHWKPVVAQGLQEQGMGHLLAEREYEYSVSSELAQRQSGEAGEQKRPAVWL